MKGYKEYYLPANEHDGNDPSVDQFGAQFWHAGQEYGVLYACAPGSAQPEEMWRLVRERVQQVREAVDAGQPVQAVEGPTNG